MRGCRSGIAETGGAVARQATRSLSSRSRRVSTVRRVASSRRNGSLRLMEIRPAEWFDDVTRLPRRGVKAEADDRMAAFVAQKVGPSALVGGHSADNKDAAFIGGAVLDLLLEPGALVTTPRRLEVAR